MLRLRNDRISLLLVGCLATGCAGAIDGETSDKASDADGKVTEPNRVAPTFSCAKDKAPGEVRMRRLTKGAV